MPRILVVDDDASIRDSIKLVLETIGIETIPADNGERALEAFNRAGCDGAIIDLIMPGMSGLETVCALREKSPDLPIVVVSGSLTRGVGVPEMLRMATELKGVTSLAKPFKLSELLQAVLAKVENHGVVRHSRRTRLASICTHRLSLIHI